MNKLVLGLLTKILAVSFLLTTAVLVNSAVVNKDEDSQNETKKQKPSSSEVASQILSPDSNVEGNSSEKSEILKQEFKSEEELALAEEAKFEQELKAISVPEYPSKAELSKTPVAKLVTKAPKVVVSTAVSLAGLDNSTQAVPENKFNQDEFLLAKEEPQVVNDSVANSVVSHERTFVTPEQTWEPQNNPAKLIPNQQVRYSSVKPSYIEESRQVRQQSASPTINVEPLENVEVLSQQSTSAKDLVLSRKIKQESRQNTVAQVKPSRTIEFSRTAQEEPVKKTPTVTVPTAVSLAGINNKPNVAPEIEQTRKKVVVAQNQEDATQKQIDEKIAKLRNIKKSFYSSPGMSVYIPVGYGSDRNTAFVTTSYQSRVRFADADDGAIGFGVGLGNAKKSVGVVLSYTAASFGGSRDFGSGGFNVKVHRQFKGGWAAAVGMNGFLNVGDYKDSSISGVNDFENSLYAVGTKIFRTRDNINKPFSRVAVSAGVGNGQFRTEDSI
ncbi:MAG: hypothetical protein AAGM40_29155, partial [Cyanobacteria bacterium J06573_2]